MKRRSVRAGAVLLAVLLSTPVAAAFVTDQVQDRQTKRVESVHGPDRGGYTAITTQQFRETYPDSELVVLAPNGSTVHLNDEYSTYFDVDPVPDRPALVEYVAADHLDGEDCDDAAVCTREVLVRENVETGDAEVLWSRITPGKHSSRIHDVDRINETHVAVADIHGDCVFVYDLEREVRTWSWSAQRDFPVDGGGPYPADWTHVNDVEVLADGTLMASLRNQDQVVFLARNGTLLDDRTIGTDDAHETLHEQHNPDYLAGERPAVLIGDSESDRAVEYERRNGTWTRTWTWQDDRVRWPRDADRLPNGHTLITDSNGDRVVEVNESGAAVWSVEIGLPYEAERLSTGDESAGGPTASEAGLESRLAEHDRTDDEGADLLAPLQAALERVLPDSVVQGVAFVLPPWMAFGHALLLALAVLDLFALGVYEFRRSDWHLRLPVARGARGERPREQRTTAKPRRTPTGQSQEQD